MFKRFITTLLLVLCAFSGYQQVYAEVTAQQNSCTFVTVKDAVKKYGNVATVKNILASDALSWAGVGITALLYNSLSLYYGRKSVGYAVIALPAAVAYYKAYYADESCKKDGNKTSWQSGIIKCIIGALGVSAAAQGSHLNARYFTTLKQQYLLAPMALCGLHSIYSGMRDLKKLIAQYKLDTKWN